MPFVFMVGTYTLGPAAIGLIEKDSPAEKAGFAIGDVIEEVNNRKITDWEKAAMLIAVNPDTDISVLIDRKGEKKTLTLHPKLDDEHHIGTSGLYPDIPVEVGKLKSGFPADISGIKIEDKILAVDGTTVYYWNQFSTIIKDSQGRKLTFMIERGGKRFPIAVTPVMDSGRYVIGVEPIIRMIFKQYGFIESLKLGFDKTVEFIDLTFITLKKLATFGLSIKTLGGPVMIAQMSGQAAAAGLSSFLSLLAMISISLGILNLLPIPVLDGGMILFLVIEAIRKKPLSRKVMEVSQSIGAGLLITLIAVVSYNDVMRMFFSK
jgi:regulator of sigma E protease